MRISFILPRYFPFPIGGYRIVYQHANALAERGHEVTVIIPRNMAEAEDLSLRTRIKMSMWPTYVRAIHRPLINWQPIHPSVRIKLAGMLSSRQVPDGDVVIATAWQTASPVADLPVSKGRKFYLVQDYETWGGVDVNEVDSTFRLPLSVLAISKWLVGLAIEKGSGCVRHVPNAIDHTLFRVTDEGFTARAPSVLALHHDNPRKDTPLALAALAKLHAKHPEVRMTMFGTFARPRDLPDWIDYRERPVQQSLVALYNAHSIYLSSSRKEGWGLPPMEAMACGCAFVGTDIGGHRDYADDGQNALLSPAEEVAPLAANLQRTVEDGALRHRLQTAGRVRVAEFNWARSGDLMEAALRS